MSVRCLYDVRTMPVRCPVVCPRYVRGMSRTMSVRCPCHILRYIYQPGSFSFFFFSAVLSSPDFKFLNSKKLNVRCPYDVRHVRGMSVVCPYDVRTIVAERGFSHPLSNQVAASHARARMTAQSFLSNMCKLLMRELGSERRDNQIGGTVPMPGSGRSSAPSLNYTEQTHHISPPRSSG